MKIVAYAIFGVAILMIFIFLLAPEDKTQKEIKPVKATLPVPEERPTSQDIVPRKSESQTESIESKPVGEVQPVASDKVRDAENEAVVDNSENQQPADFLSTPDDLTFDASEVPDFPPLPPLEDEEPPPFDEFPTQGFPEEDFGEGGFGSDEGFPLESGPQSELGSREF